MEGSRRQFATARRKLTELETKLAMAKQETGVNLSSQVVPPIR